MKCTNCGAGNGANDKFCASCGASLEEATVKITAVMSLVLMFALIQQSFK